MTTQLTFQSTALTAISHNNQTYISSSDLARALQYSDFRSVTKIFTRYEDEFTADMSEVVNLTTSGNLETTSRIFSLRGCHLIAMFARTPVAKEFRKWVLDILDKENLSQNLPQKQPLEEQAKALSVIMDLYSFGTQAFEMAHQLERSPLRSSINRQIGGHYLHNLQYPLKNALDRAKAFIQADNERIMFVKGALSLLEK